MFDDDPPGTPDPMPILLYLRQPRNNGYEGLAGYPTAKLLRQGPTPHEQINKKLFFSSLLRSRLTRRVL